MEQEDKNLLLKDLCSRIPYTPSVLLNGKERCLLTGIDGEKVYLSIDSEPFDLSESSIKPYLRPMSSMTEEERNEMKQVICPNGTGYFSEQYLVCPVNHFGEQISFDFMSDIIDWLNQHHFDYRGLIPMGLALEAAFFLRLHSVSVIPTKKATR